MTTLADLARGKVPCAAASTAGWIMPARGFNRPVELYILSPGDIAALVTQHSLPPGTRGLADWGCNPPRIWVPPLESVLDMELWRHELRHVEQGHWHA